MKHPLRSTLVTAMIAGFALTSHAADGPTVTVSGFGTAAVTVSDNNDAEYARPQQLKGAGTSPRSSVDSIFGIQATAKFNDSLSFTAQGLARENARGYFGAEVAWAFAKFKATDSLSIRVGRIGAPVYMISDFRNVGYANTMIRPPAEVYRQVSFDALDGIDFLYQQSFGDTSVTGQVAVGNVDSPVSADATVSFKPATALHLVVENGPFTFRVGRAFGKYTLNNSVTFNTLLASLNRFGFTSVAQELDITDVKGTFTSAGFTMDHNNFLIQSEYAVRRTDSRVAADSTSYYAMFGYRAGKFTPYYSYARAKQDGPRTFPSMPSTGPLAPLAAGAALAGQAAMNDTHAIGVRWDFKDSAALKAQLDHITPEDGHGGFVNPKPGFKGPVNVFAVGIDFVF
ncbi:hypothetical protein KY495_22275 [Massilia sp. PAMC28688]|uniref:hypothetical protein n=1 Tax=Massilia sp. PAMC28688 TaxID=2861283 RepID=UPI001C638F8A|nr:hypothetical protein [Massilia sp. PAMC28688]QYF93363.1 hypothetical protein KY495_22275 [Massilia sp. PAMC28688]